MTELQIFEADRGQFSCAFAAISAYITVCCLSGALFVRIPFQDFLKFVDQEMRLGEQQKVRTGFQLGKGVLKGRRDDIELHIEYINGKGISDPFHFFRLSRRYRFRLDQVKFDLVIVSDNDAFDFTMRYRNSLFPGVPVICCGISPTKCPNRYMFDYAAINRFATGQAQLPEGSTIPSSTIPDRNRRQGFASHRSVSTNSY
ncbi:hypothetical protein [Syntrophorhabdus aromaticivorans]|uniref:hypothetical protein n=1 Tax=Syntrophorhabdus aromaticivorans TaxID=328301 RepID=UPI000491BD33|nr:hypothetical protein [Syntrophorhabdus aromaticivorans]